MLLIEFWLYDSNFQVKIFFVWLFFFSSASLFLFRADIHLINHSYDFTRSWKLIIIHLLLFSVSVFPLIYTVAVISRFLVHFVFGLRLKQKNSDKMMKSFRFDFFSKLIFLL